MRVGTGLDLILTVLIALLNGLLAGPVLADCASPAGVAGQTSYNSGIMQFCNGTTWQSMKGAPVLGGCSVAGLFQYVPDTDFTWCDGSALWSAKGDTSYGPCSSNGQWAWDISLYKVKGCIGGAWYALRPGADPVDTTAPTVSFLLPSSNYVYGSDTGISASATDDYVVARMECYIDGALIYSTTDNPFTTTWTFTTGIHTIMVKAYDLAGHVTSLSKSINRFM